MEHLFFPDRQNITSYEGFKYTPARTVGTARVREIIGGENSPFDVVFLDIKKEDEVDRSPVINDVPKGWFRRGDSAEVIVKEFNGSWLSFSDWIYLAEGGFYVVAIRPFKPGTFGRPVNEEDPGFKAMFRVNVKAPLYAHGFYEKFSL